MNNPSNELHDFEAKCSRCGKTHSYQLYGSGQPPEGWVTLRFWRHFITTTTAPGSIHQEPVICPSCYETLSEWMGMPLP